MTNQKAKIAWSCADDGSVLYWLPPGHRLNPRDGGQLFLYVVLNDEGRVGHYDSKGRFVRLVLGKMGGFATPDGLLDQVRRMHDDAMYANKYDASVRVRLAA